MGRCTHPAAPGWVIRPTRPDTPPTVDGHGQLLPITAGVVATVVFASSTLPMLGKAVRTKDLASYSRGNLVLANVGNAVYSVYVFTCRPGPIWLLHTFYILTSALMLVWSLRYGRRFRPADDPAAPAAITQGDHHAH